MAERSVFHDPTGRRRKRFTLALTLFVLLNLLAAAALFASIRLLPAEPPLPIALEHGKPLPPSRQSLLKRTSASIDHAVQRLLGTRPPSARRVGALPHVAAATALGQRTSVGFYTPWDPSSVESLKQHVGDLDWLAPVWVTVTGNNHRLQALPDTAGRAIINAAAHRPLILPVIQNAANGVFDGPNTARLLADPALRKQLLDRLEPFLVANHASGMLFDLEELDPTAQANFRLLLGEARRRSAARHWIVAIAAPVGSDWNLRAFARVSDRIFLMAYDEHTNDGEAGPIASMAWWANQVRAALQQLPRDKVIVTLGNYAYDWHGKGGEPLSVEEAWQEAAESDAIPVWDPASGNSTFAFDDETGQRHTVWILDGTSAFNQLSLLERAGVKGVALWRMGGEDPSLWTAFGRGARRPLDAALLQSLPQVSNVDVEGNGEILRIASLPSAGHRRITLGRDGLISNVVFQQLPKPYTINRTGGRPGLVALTFDDGPDKRWTPQILDILKANHVPATFFIVGENGLTEVGLLRRMVDEGNEIGSHTYTHPNLATTGTGRTLFELNATQRMFQAFTGRSLKLFRAPYFGDAEPTTADEILPALEAQQRGYISVGLHVDSEDWQRPGVPAIVRNVVSGVVTANPERSGNIVLLHDSGGDRSQTVAALPQIIAQLKARGYRFVPVSALAGLSPAQAMPTLSTADRATAQFSLFLFLALGFAVTALGVLFAVALTLGVARAIVLSGLALLNARRELARVRPPIDPATFVTVLIPAYNEEAVIERSVRTVLASSDVRLEVIVIDDGSKDRTSAIVAEQFGTDDRVRLLTLENGGKARALNQGLALAHGEIVIALDADTQFEPTTIARLARWFAADPRLGAVAGNAKVGNRVNLVTRWQALEYVTAQNLERRALAWLGAMTVVPGAVGAWRKAAIDQVGGYPADTLAEDQDLTIAVQRAGWGVTYDQSAIAWTEAPHSLRQLAKQRFRWAFGTIQCLWKHKRVMADGRPRGLAFVGLPQAILFQLLFALVSPLIDLALIVSIVTTGLSIHDHGLTYVQGDLNRMATFWLLFAAIDLVAGLIAFALERREKWRLIVWLLPMRFVYRQIMYYVVIKATVQALRGPKVGWTTVARRGSVELAPAAPARVPETVD